MSAIPCRGFRKPDGQMMNLWMGDTTKVAAVAVGVVTLHFSKGKQLVLDDCLYVPSVRRNQISIPSLACNEYSTLFNKKFIFVKYCVDVICVGTVVDNLYLVKPIIPMQINSYESNHKRKE